MVPDKTPNSLDDISDRIVFVALHMLLGFGVVLAGCVVIWLSGHMCQSLLPDPVSVERVSVKRSDALKTLSAPSVPSLSW